MNAAQILSKAQALGVRLSLSGGLVKLRGSAEAIAEIKPEIAKHKPDIVAWLKSHPESQLAHDCIGLPISDGAYFPWCAPVAPEQVRRWQRELDEAIETLAALEEWPAEKLERMRFLVERQPISTLLPDLHWFLARVKARRET